MLIAVSAIASALALMGVLLIGYSTHNIAASMPRVKDPNSQLVAFPADIEAQLKQQSMTSTGVAAIAPPAGQDAASQQVADLRDALAQAKGEVPAENEAPGEADATAGADAQNAANQQAQPPASIEELTAKLERIVLDHDSGDDSQASETDLTELRNSALQELSTQDGRVVLPHYELNLNGDESELVGELARQLSSLQDGLNEQIASLPELQGKQIDVASVDLKLDAQQLDAALDGLKLQADLLGVELPSDLRYDALHGMGDALLKGSGASLDGLDMDELQAVSRDMLNELNISVMESDDADNAVSRKN